MKTLSAKQIEALEWLAGRGDLVRISLGTWNSLARRALITKEPLAITPAGLAALEGRNPSWFGVKMLTHV